MVSEIIFRVISELDPTAMAVIAGITIVMVAVIWSIARFGSAEIELGT